MNNNVAWACLDCGVVIDHPNATKNPEIRKTTQCLKCLRGNVDGKGKNDAR